MKNIIQKILIGLAKGYSHLPLWYHYGVSSVLYFFGYHVTHYRRNVVRKNLEGSFPEKSKEELRTIEKQFYRHLTDLAAESIKGLTISDEDVQKRFVAKNLEQVKEYLKAGRSIFFYGAHMGNWEWFIALPDQFNEWATTQAFYQKQSNEYFDALTLELRSRGGIVPIESHKAFITMARKAKAGEQTITLVLGDQSPHRGAKKIWLNFLHRESAFLAGPETMARKLDVVLFYPHFKKTGRGHYEVEFKLITDNPKALGTNECTARYAALLEDNIREEPEIWLWTHKRWKHKRENFPDE